jgi:hypothetical protein
VQQDLLAVLGDPPGAQHRLARQAGVQPLGHLAHGGAAQQAGAAGVPKGGLDVAGAQPARVHLDGELLERSGAAGQPGAHARHKRLGAIGHLRDPVLDRALGASQPTTAIAVAIPAPRLGAVLVVAAAERLAHFRLEGLLDDLADRRLQQLGPGIAIADPVRQQLI